MLWRRAWGVGWDILYPSVKTIFLAHLINYLFDILLLVHTVARTMQVAALIFWKSWGLIIKLIQEQPRFLVQAACGCHPWWWMEVKVAIVFTYFFSSFSFLFSFFLLRLLLFTHFGESPVRENLFSPIFWHS